MCAKQNNKGNVDNTAERKALLQQTADYQTWPKARRTTSGCWRRYLEADKEIAKKPLRKGKIAGGKSEQSR